MLSHRISGTSLCVLCVVRESVVAATARVSAVAVVCECVLEEKMFENIIVGYAIQ